MHSDVARQRWYSAALAGALPSGALKGTLIRAILLSCRATLCWCHQKPPQDVSPRAWHIRRKSAWQSLKETHTAGKTLNQRQMLLKRQVLFWSPPCKPCYVVFVQDCNIRVSLSTGHSYKDAWMYQPHLKLNPCAKVREQRSPNPS